MVSQLSRLRQGRTDWNNWRAQNRQIEINFGQAKLNGMNLSGYDLSGACLVNASLIDANLQDANLSGADCRNARFIAAILNGTSFDHALLDGADFLTAVVSRISLRALDLRKLNLASFDLSSADLEGANLSGQQLQGFDLSKANLVGCNFTQAQLQKANLQGALMSGADLQHANLTAAVLKDAKMDGADLRSAKLTGVNASSVIFDNADLRGADLTDALFDGSSLNNCRLAATNLVGWSIRNVRCQQCSWEDRGQDFTHYKTGEFEKLYGARPMIRLRYPGGIRSQELATLPFLLEHLAASKWGCLIRLQEIVDVPGATQVVFSVDEMGDFDPTELLPSLQQEAESLQLAHMELRENQALQQAVRTSLSEVKEKHWPRMLELAAEHQAAQQRHLTVLFVDLQNFSRWKESELAMRLELFRGLLKPILNRWQAAYPNMEGDSLRVTFHNASIAIECALMVQKVLSSAGFCLRIGIDLGPVYVSQNAVTGQADLGGSALNFAARLESVAKPGEVLVSDRVRHFARSAARVISFEARRVVLRKGVGKHNAGTEVVAYSVSRLGGAEGDALD